MHLGIDVLERQGFKSLWGARVGLCVNLASCNSALKPTLTLIADHKKVNLSVIFAPEHGLFGALQDQVPAGSFYDDNHRVQVYSLYDETLVPENAITGKIDVVVIDLQDVGSRYYTFIWSVIMLIEECTRLRKKVVVLDRPNPLNGQTLEGPVLDPEYVSFVGLYTVPIRHGMTIAELCSMMNNEMGIGADLKIIKMHGWKRNMYHDDTGLTWTMPSPNMPWLSTALVYPGLCLLEGTNISEGRGTTRPFEICGAPWVDGFTIASVLGKKKLPGVCFRPISFIPTFHKYQNQLCGGIHIHIKNRTSFNPVATGLEIIKTIRNIYPHKFRWRKPPYEFEKKKMPFDILVGNNWIRKSIEDNRNLSSMTKKWQKNLCSFAKRRKGFLLYN